ncbi:protein MANBAL-like [Excalfactoria chinensis]|uniref:protein MANBAL-like n=2 Tax=Excalfactoria chinensis TaxID=46218 RepID=UPI003B3BCB55
MQLGFRRAVWSCRCKVGVPYCKRALKQCWLSTAHSSVFNRSAFCSLYFRGWRCRAQQQQGREHVHNQQAASVRAVEQQAVCTMAAELHFSPPEIPEPTLMENVLRYGLLFGALFQLLCVLAIILPVSKSPKADSEGFESKTWETVKKPKASAAQLSKKAKKESKKKR